jgi:K+-transporting ATPase, KdpF subunit
MIWFIRKGGLEMLDLILGGIVTVGLLAYLSYALINAENI